MVEREGKSEKHNPPHKSWTLDKNHRFNRGDMFRLEAKLGDYDLQVLQATPYPRMLKTLKYKQPVRPYNLTQKELRVEVGDGIDVKPDTTLYVPHDFYSAMYIYLDGTKYTQDEVKELINKSGLKVKTGKTPWRT